MTTSHHTETAFKEVIEPHLLAYGYIPVDRTGFDRASAIFPETVLAFIRETQPKEWAKPTVQEGEGWGSATHLFGGQ